MRFYTINLRKLKKPLLIVHAVLIAMLIMSISAGAFLSSFSDTLYVAVAIGANEEKLIIIDPGHGGEDSGAIGANGVLEKDLNLQMSLHIGELLVEEGYTVIYTRTDDRLLYGEAGNIAGMKKIYDLKNRCLVAKENPNAVFVSIHMNSFGESKYSGLQVYYSPNNPDSGELAGLIQTEVIGKIQPNNKRNTKLGRDLYLMENTYNPAVLVECGFISNPEECKKLSEKEYQKQLSFAIVCGIIRYMEAKNV